MRLPTLLSTRNVRLRSAWAGRPEALTGFAWPRTPLHLRYLFGNYRTRPRMVFCVHRRPAPATRRNHRWRASRHAGAGHRTGRARRRTPGPRPAAGPAHRNRRRPGKRTHHLRAPPRGQHAAGGRMGGLHRRDAHPRPARLGRTRRARRPMDGAPRRRGARRLVRRHPAAQRCLYPGGARRRARAVAPGGGATGAPRTRQRRGLRAARPRRPARWRGRCAATARAAGTACHACRTRGDETAIDNARPRGAIGGTVPCPVICRGTCCIHCIDHDAFRVAPNDCHHREGRARAAGGGGVCRRRSPLRRA